MKKSLVLTFAFILTSVLCYAQKGPDAVVGTWFTGKGRVQIYKQGDKYYGKIVWLAEPNDKEGKPKADKKNPDEKKRTQPILGLVNLRDFTYDEDNVWEDGRIYNPEEGKDYSCKMTLKDPDTLEVRGFVGISLIGKTVVWKRVK
ncbi:DUF2147 domain-containing protein [Cytophagaceae bacterium DM2B3-1]|uniref:DUF2147 domain-containing protein n=1 Tax=Xanthocytophaga flava TaxID=3048013 RepID=A0ABT7CPD0_9BACT|nr:DUF2147 domain-containing protein [Xanthocytophaga flavus]MDJ1468744.1 DUF2147 domain-containing protein [Xanthocytophaga flavus]MDJ1495604.1 DUF2147 domain-containing protein [Xanthocytophaga flavus]